MPSESDSYGTVVLKHEIQAMDKHEGTAENVHEAITKEFCETVHFRLDENDAEEEDMIAAIEANGLKPVVDTTFPLAELADAFRHQEAQKHFGKIVLTI